MSGVRIEVQGLDEMIDTFGRLANPESAVHATEQMDVSLREGFAATEAALAPHLRTGRTAASGQVHSEFVGEEWHGEITYGIDGEEGEHSTGARWLLVQHRDDYLAPLEETSRQIGDHLDRFMSDILRGTTR